MGNETSNQSSRPNYSSQENKQVKQTKEDPIVTISILLDESGSMESTKSYTLESLNSFILKQKRLPTDSVAETKVSLTKFNTNVTSVYKNRPLHEVEPLHVKDYVPEGGTALFDAIGNVIGEVDQTIPDGPVIVVILTDGEENSSKEFNSKQILKLVKTMEDEKGWKFVYLGANQDSFTNAKNIGISSAQNFAQTKAGITTMMDQIGESMSSYRKAVKSSSVQPGGATSTPKFVLK